MRNSYLNALTKEAGGKAAARTTPTRRRPKADDGKDQARKLAQANREDLEGRVSARVYLQSLSKLGLHVPPRVQLTDRQVKVACDSAGLAVRAVVKRRAA